MNTKASMAILIAGLCLAAGPAPAAPLQKSEINPAAKWVVHADLEAFRGSAIGKLVMAELKAQGIEQKMQEFAAVFSFQPLTDIRDITLYGKGPNREDAVVIADGKFDAEKLLGIVRWNPQYKEIPHEGVTLYQWLNEDKKNPAAEQIMYGYIHGAGKLAISSGLEALKQAVNTLKQPPAGDSTGLIGQIPAPEKGGFLQVVARDIAQFAGQEPKAAILRQADSLTLSAGEAADRVFIALQVQGQTPEVTQNIANLVQGVVAMAQLAAQEQPKLSDLAKSVKITYQDRTMQVRFEAAAQTVFGFLKEQWQQKQQQSQQPPVTTP